MDTDSVYANTASGEVGKIEKMCNCLRLFASHKVVHITDYFEKKWERHIIYRYTVRKIVSENPENLDFFGFSETILRTVFL